MKDIDLGYALFLWKTDHQGCFYCALNQDDELCPKEHCTKDGYYRIIMDDDFKYYNIHEEVRRCHPHFGCWGREKNDKKNSD